MQAGESDEGGDEEEEWKLNMVRGEKSFPEVSLRKSSVNYQSEYIAAAILSPSPSRKHISIIKNPSA